MTVETGTRDVPRAAVSLVDDADGRGVAVTVAAGDTHYTVRLRVAGMSAAVTWSAGRLQSCTLHRRRDGRGWRPATLQDVREAFGLNGKGAGSAPQE